MSEHDLPALDARARRVVEAGRAEIAPPDGARERLRARLGAALPPKGGGGGGGAHGGGARARVPAWSVGVAFVAGGALGFAARGAPRAAPAPAPVAQIASAAPPTELANAILTPPAHDLAPPRDLAPPARDPAPTRGDPAPSASPSARSAAPRARSALSAERAILDVARTALARGDGARSLAAAREHEAKFPRGALAEEREAIYVQALVVDGQKGEARARAARFRSAYPDSMLLPAVDAATREAP